VNGREQLPCCVACFLTYLIIVASEENHADCDCFAVAVLTHGDYGLLYGVDESITVDSFIEPIKHCSTLAGKPKIFVFQVVSVNRLLYVIFYDLIMPPPRGH